MVISSSRLICMVPQAVKLYCTTAPVSIAVMIIWNVTARARVGRRASHVAPGSHHCPHVRTGIGHRRSALRARPCMRRCSKQPTTGQTGTKRSRRATPACARAAPTNNHRRRQSARARRHTWRDAAEATSPARAGRVPSRDFFSERATARSHRWHGWPSRQLSI
jgi:hypothetical protein